ncbi:MAG: hypothetical protein KKB13_19795 [Chloroflexi bacterium]|nr:hypothetical protein [Chloroflexota bacterium]
MNKSGQILAHSFKIAEGSATCGAQLDAAVDLPASGSYIDVSGYERVHILAKFGTIHGSDAPVLEPKCSDAADGTLDQIDSDLAHTAAADDDQEWVAWTIEVAKLPEDHHFLAVDVTGGATNGSYAEVFFLLEGLSLPVTQTTAVLPSASQYEYCG